MQFLAFHLGEERYGLPARDLARVLPFLECRPLAGAPDFVAGLIDYQGTPVPVIDLPMLVCRRPALPFLDTRILLVNYRPSPDDARLLGLIAERVTGLVVLEQSDFCEPGVATALRCLGKVATAAGLLQLVDLDHLLTGEVRAVLFPKGDRTC